MSSTTNSGQLSELSAPQVLTDADLDAVVGGGIFRDFVHAVGHAVEAVGHAIEAVGHALVKA